MTSLIQVYFVGPQVLIINNTNWKSSFFILVSGLSYLKESILLVSRAFSVTDASCALQYSFMLHLNKIKNFRGPFSALEMGRLSGI